MYLLINMGMEQSRWAADRVDMRIRQIRLLQDVKDKLIERLNITVPIHDLTSPMIDELSAIIKNNPGKTLLSFHVIDGENNVSLNLIAQDVRLTVTNDLIDFLKESDCLNFQINN